MNYFVLFSKVVSAPFFGTAGSRSDCKVLRAIRAAMFLFIFSGLPVAALDGAVDPYFMTGSGVSGGVQAVAVQTDGKILIGGWFTSVNGYSSNRLARLNANGSLDASFNVGTGANGEIRALALQPDGKIIIAGLFTGYQGAARNRVARINADGSLDLTFDVGTGADGDIQTVVLQPDGRILLGGNFTVYNGIASRRVARVNPNGGFDNSFNGGGGANASVIEIALQADGKILIGGQFTAYDSTASNRLARLNADGSPDSTFDIGTGANNFIEAVTLQPDGKVLIGGDFTDFNGVTRNRIARINENGSLDQAFDPGGGADFTVYDIAVQTNGRILVGGIFLSFRGSPPQRLTRILSDGALDPTFNQQSGITAQVFDIHPFADGRILVGGWFTGGGTTAPNRVAVLNANGGVNTAFRVASGFGNDVSEIVPQPDGKILVSGSFLASTGTSLSGVARLHRDGSFDTTFNPPSGADQVGALALQSDGKVLIGGYFGNVGGATRNRIARLNADGSLDVSFDPAGGAVSSSGSALVGHITVQADGKIIVGGNFNQFNGAARFGIARLNADGSLDTSFNPGGNPLFNVQSTVIQSDGKIIVGGYFDKGIARLNSDGSPDSTFNTGSGTNHGVAAVKIQRDGKILIGGYFASYNGAARNNLARLNRDGTLDQTFNANVENNFINVFAIVVQRDGKIFLVGNFGSVGGVYRNRTARVHPNGSLDVSFVANTDSPIDYVYAAAQEADGNLLIGGNFTQVGGVQRLRLARLLNTPKTAFADFDGDGIADLSVFRPSNGAWYSLNSYAGYSGIQFGAAGDRIVPADYDGDGKIDAAVFRDGIWYLQRSALGFTGIAFGDAGDIPVPADYDADGKADVAVFRPSNGVWYLLRSSLGFTGIAFGQAGDKPVPADYDGDGKTDVAVNRSGTWYLNRSSLGFTGIQFGDANDKSVPADYDGDGRADVAVYRPSNGTWYLQRSAAGFTGAAFGISTDLPAPADYDGDGKADVAVFRNGVWYLNRSTSGFTGAAFGAADDKPVPNAFVQ